MNVNVSSGYKMTKPTIILFNSNFNVISYKQFPDNATNLYWSIPKDKIKDGTNNYNFAYAGIYKDKKFIFYFKPIQITKVYVNLEVQQVATGSTSFTNENKGYVGDQFAFVGITNVKLPDSYGMYIAFMDVDENGKNTGYFGPYYRMVKKDDTTYYYKKTIQKAGQNRKYKICIQDNYHQNIDCRVGIYTVLEKPIQINNYNITKINETNDYVDYEMKISLSKKPKSIKIQTEKNNYDLLKYDVMVGYIVFKPNFATFMDYSSDYKTWTIKFRIYKSNETQNKSFTLIVKDTSEIKQTESFIVPKKSKANVSLDVTADSYSKQIPAKFTFTVTTSSKIDALKVTTSKNESQTRLRDGYGMFGSIQIKPIDDLTWQVTYSVNTVYPFNAKENDITLNFYALTKDLKTTLASKSIKIKVYRDTSEEDFSDILNFLNKSPILSKLNLGDKNIRYAPISRAEAALIVYEFLKLKNTDFKLPYDINLYSNPFADLDRNTNYYDAVVTLANYKGDDDITVLTKKFGVFNPLDYVKRFQFVKMIIEGLNISKTNDFSYIKNYSDYNELGEDAKVYFATAVKNGIIKGDNNKLLSYQDLTIFQALTILDRVKDYNLNVNDNQFIQPDFSNQIGTTLGIIPDIQEYNPDVTPIKIINIDDKKDGNCTKLTVIANVDKDANEYYVWSTNFGYFKKVDENNREVIFCPATKKPNVDYQIKVLGNDGYFNFDENNITLSRNDYVYSQNIADKNTSVVKFDISLSVSNKKMKENALFEISKTGSLYKNKLNVGLEKVSVVLSDGNTNYTINNVKWNEDKIYFIVPSIKEFYGKALNMKVIIGSNDKFKKFDFSNVVYNPIYMISGAVSADKNGNYPQFVYINNKKVELHNGGFNYIADSTGKYNIEINKYYPPQIVEITDKNPTAYVYMNYIDLDYDDDGVENGKDAFPYNPAYSVDNDKDGYPDKYNEGYTSGDLPIDKYPNDPNKWNDEQPVCAQVITHAYNPKTGEEKDFSTPCDVPEGWIVGKAPDFDGDGINDILDTDDDNDGISDDEEIKFGTDPHNSNSKPTPLMLKIFNKKLIFTPYHKNYDIAIKVDSIFGDDINIDVESNNNYINIQRSWNDVLKLADYIDNNLTLHLSIKDNLKKGIMQDKLIFTLTDQHNNILKTDINVTILNGDFVILKGWNLKSAVTDLSIDNLKNFYIIWKWDNKNEKWLGWSGNKKINEAIKKHNFGNFNYILSQEGFWVYSKKDMVEDINENYKIINDKNYKKIDHFYFGLGWKLVGFTKDIDVDYLLKHSKYVKVIWLYDNIKKEWKLYGENINENYYLKYKKLKFIPKGEGVWIYFEK